MDKCLLSACSNKYYPSILNLIGSLKANYPNHPRLYVYDLGLLPFFKKQLAKLPGVEVLDLPFFSPFHLNAYTWKTYILSHPLAKLNFYLDAGAEVLAPLEEIFTIIDRADYFALTLDPRLPLVQIVPEEFKPFFRISPELYTLPCLAAGIFGFKRASQVTASLETLLAGAQAGLTLGFSPSENWRNHGKNRSVFVRNCPTFRHDQTLLNLLLREKFGAFKLYLQPAENPGGTENSTVLLEHDLIRIIGRGYKKLPYLPLAFPKKRKFIKTKLLIFLKFKSLRLKIKKFLWK